MSNCGVNSQGRLLQPLVFLPRACTVIMISKSRLFSDIHGAMA